MEILDLQIAGSEPNATRRPGPFTIPGVFVGVFRDGSSRNVFNPHVQTTAQSK